MTDSARVTLLTPRGRGAVAVISYRGPVDLLDRSGLFRAANGKPLSEQELNRICYGHWGSTTTEEVVVTRTEMSLTEIHCHGGNAAVERIADQLRNLGAVPTSWQEAARDELGRLDAECFEMLARAPTRRTATHLHAQAEGTLRDTFEHWAQLDDAAFAEAVTDVLEWSSFGLHLTEPWSVVLAGRPNVGKSSLINRLVGYARAIVYDQPGTTRDVVTAESALDGWAVRFSDTAGFRENADALEAAGITRADAVLEAADCRLIVFDVSEPPREEDRKLLDRFSDAIHVANKSDLENAWGKTLPKDSCRVSAATGAGIDRLIEKIVAVLVPRVPDVSAALPVTARQVHLLESAHALACAGRLSEARELIRAELTH